MSSTTKEATRFRALLNRLIPFWVDLMPSTNGGEADTPPHEREPGEYDGANVISSKIAGTNRHTVVLDIDHPTYLLKSSTPGHYHLFIDVPGGVDGAAYEHLLKALAIAGVIEHGYRSSAIARGWSAVRLPWIKKTDEERAAAEAAKAEREAAIYAAAREALAPIEKRRTAEATERFRLGIDVPAEVLGKWAEHVSRPPGFASLPGRIESREQALRVQPLTPQEARDRLLLDIEETF